MVTCSLFGRETKLQGSPLTLVEYHKEFGGDLMSDLVEAYKGDIMNGAILLQIAWALTRTVDVTLPHFNEWLEGFEPEKFDLKDTRPWEVIDSAINAELFCAKETSRKRRDSKPE